MRFAFSSQELFTMAYVSRKQKMYGIPNAFEGLQQAERQLAVQLACEKLFDKGVMYMNADGQYLLNSEYDTIVSYYCTCSCCLTVTTQKGTGTGEGYIFWKKDNQFMQAEVMGTQYFISSPDPLLISDCCRNVFKSGAEVAEKSIEVPNVILTKAKRLCDEGKYDDAFRTLRQNGADEMDANFIMQGLQHKAGYVGAMMMTPDQDGCAIKERAYLCARNTVMELSQSISNFRTCTKFTPVCALQAETALSDLVRDFVGGE